MTKTLIQVVETESIAGLIPANIPLIPSVWIILLTILDIDSRFLVLFATNLVLNKSNGYVTKVLVIPEPIPAIKE